MTLNLISLTLDPYVSLFSVICMVVLACFGTFVRRRRLKRKEPHVDLLPQVKTIRGPPYITSGDRGEVDKNKEGCLMSVLLSVDR